MYVLMTIATQAKPSLYTLKICFSVKDEINHPIEKCFRVNFVRNDVLFIC